MRAYRELERARAALWESERRAHDAPTLGREGKLDDYGSRRVSPVERLPPRECGTHASAATNHAIPSKYMAVYLGLESC